jgi:hypothetical protein
VTDRDAFVPLAPFMRERARIHPIASLLVLVATIAGALRRDPEDGSWWALLLLVAPIVIALVLGWLYQRRSGWQKVTDRLRPVDEDVVVLEPPEVMTFARRGGWAYSALLVVMAFWSALSFIIVGLALTELILGRTSAAYEERTGRQILRPRRAIGDPPFAWRPLASVGS